MQLWCLSNKLMLFTSPRIYSTTHKQRYKNINIRTYKYLFTYFQRRDGPSASKWNWICLLLFIFFHFTFVRCQVRWRHFWFLLHYKQKCKKNKKNRKVKPKRLDKSNVTKQKHRDTSKPNQRTHSYTHMHTRTALTLAWLNFLDDSQLVSDEHRRAEVSLECSRLMEGRTEHKGFYQLP